MLMTNPLHVKILHKNKSSTPKIDKKLKTNNNILINNCKNTDQIWFQKAN